MGVGDELMAAAQARALADEHGKKVAIVDKRGNRRWHWIWRDHPCIATQGHRGEVVTLKNGPSCRPYVDYERTTKERWAYTNWSVNEVGPGEIFCLRRRKSGDYVAIEPHIKANASPNKQWGWANWQALVDLLPNVDWFQLGPRGTETLKGVRLIETESFLRAAEMLSGARAAVLPEGGLHHAAASLGIPAVVLFGGMLSPLNTGYKQHLNLAVDAPEALGWRIPHPACERAWREIKPQIVAKHVRNLL